MLPRIISSLQRRTRIIFYKLVLVINHISQNKKLPRVVPSHYFDLVKDSRIFKSDGIDQFRILQEWDETDALWNQGLYFKAVEKRRALIQEIYAFHKVDIPGYFPPAVSVDYTGPFGHVAMLGVHLRAQELAIIPSGSRVVPILNEKSDRAVTRAILTKYQPMYFQEGPAWGEFPLNWHVSERLQMIRGQKDFHDLYEILETTYSYQRVNKSNPILNLDLNYEEQARFALKSLGLPDKRWFVSIHIRNAGEPGLRRNQPNESYLAAIRFILSQGGYVIRIGDSTMQPFPKIKGLIDLSRDSENYWLHSFALANGRFHIGTTSGPGWIPSLFGVPTLITNTTAIGRNMHSLSEKSRFIPKHIVSNSQKWSFSRILESTEAYAENEIDAKSSNYRLEPNSEIEILQATQELFKSVFEEDSSRSSSHMSAINKTRSQLGAIGYGDISESFVNLNETSFLK